MGRPRFIACVLVLAALPIVLVEFGLGRGQKKKQHPKKHLLLEGCLLTVGGKPVNKATVSAYLLGKKDFVGTCESDGKGLFKLKVPENSSKNLTYYVRFYASGFEENSMWIAKLKKNVLSKVLTKKGDPRATIASVQDYTDSIDRLLNFLSTLTLGHRKSFFEVVSRQGTFPNLAETKTMPVYFKKRLDKVQSVLVNLQWQSYSKKIKALGLP